MLTVTGDLFAAVSAPSGQFYYKLKLSYFFLLNASFIVTIRVDFHLDEQELLVFEKLKGVSTTARTGQRDSEWCFGGLSQLHTTHMKLGSKLKLTS